MSTQIAVRRPESSEIQTGVPAMLEDMSLQERVENFYKDDEYPADKEEEEEAEPTDSPGPRPTCDWAYPECESCCCSSAIISYTLLEPPSVRCLQCMCCGNMPDFQGADAWSGAVNRVAGVMYACGCALLANCWLEYPPHGLDGLTVVIAHMALVLLNSIDSAIMTSDNPTVRRRATIVLALCYTMFFVALARSFWLEPVYTGIDQASPELVNACRSSQAVHCIVLIVVATTLRFAGHVFGVLWSPGSTGTASQGSPPMWVSVVMAVVAAMSLVGGLTAHCMAVFGEEGTDVALFVPPVYILPLPLLLTIRLKIHSPRSGTVWRTWYAFVPTVMYCACVLWPLVLYSNSLLSKQQAVYSLVGACGIVIAGRIGMSALDQVTHARVGSGSSSSSSAMMW